MGTPSTTFGRYLNLSAARIEARLNTVVGLPSLVVQSIATTSLVDPLAVTVNSTVQKPSIPRDAALLGYSGATFTIGRYSPPPLKPPMFMAISVSKVGASILRPSRFASGASNSGSGTSGGGV